MRWSTGGRQCNSNYASISAPRRRFRFRFSLLDFVSFWIAGKSGAVIVDLPVVAQAHSRFLHTDFQHSSVLHVAQAEKHFPLAAVHFT